MSETLENIKEQISTSDILPYMKGNPNQPMCGFSAKTVQAVMACGERFAYFNMLAHPNILAELPKFANRRKLIRWTRSRASSLSIMAARPEV